MTTCHGCKHFRSSYEECEPLMSQLYCRPCKRKWKIADEGCRCTKCKGYREVIEVADCAGGRPSRWCPGFEALPPIMGQGTLFD